MVKEEISIMSMTADTHHLVACINVEFDDVFNTDSEGEINGI
jgi:hypothetical protein